MVSVIIIFCNAERFIAEAIESVLAQTYDHWELLLVDDGSTDRSRMTALRYVAQYPDKVHCLEHEGHQNRGMSAARNLGIHHAQGQYVALLDADDVWLPHKLAQQVVLLNSQPDVGMVYGATQWWYSWTGRPEDRHRDFVHPLGVASDTLIQPPSLLVRFLRNEGISPCTCSILARREVLDRIGGFEESFRGLYEDQAFCAKICLDMPILASSACWYRYRQHPDSASAVAQRTGQHRAARLVFLNWLAAYLTDHEVKDMEVWRALETELWQCRHPLLTRLRARTQRVARVINTRAQAVVSPGGGG
jgi:glycosyltransferase involved in cell wall biosynthesis